MTGSVSVNIYSVSFTNPIGAKFGILYQGVWYYDSPLNVAHGSIIRVQVDPNTGYQVDSIKLGNTVITNGSDQTITGATSLTATASLKTYTVTINNPTGATISATVNDTNYTNTFTATHGTSIKYNVSASTGYDVTSFTYGGTTINNGDTRVLTENVTVTAAATLKTYEVNIIQPSDGTIRVGGNTSKFTAKHFSSYDVTLTPATGYSVESLTWNGSRIANGSKQTVTGATTVTGTTSAIPQTITITQPSNGIIKVRYNGTDYTSSFSVPYNSTITITATPNTGYKLNSLTYGDSTINSGASKTVTGPVTITGSFSILSNSVSFSQPANGSIKLTYNGTDYTSSINNVTYGSKVKVTVSANTGYYIDSITANGETITNGSEITVNSAIDIVANIYLIYRILNVDASVHQSYTLTLTKSSTYGGTLPSYTSTATKSAQNNLSVPYGTTYSITYTGDTGYNASAAKSGTITTDTNITHTDASLTPYTVTIAQSSNQTITVTCDGKSYTSNFTATYGQHWTASISPETNYIAGTLSATSGTITGPVTISATAATIKPKLTLNEVANGYWTVNGTNVGASYSAYYNPGTQLTVECFANEGYIKPTELIMETTE